MSKALAFAAFIIVLAIFLPTALNAFENLLLVLIQKATVVVESVPAIPPLPATGTADVSRTLQ